MTQGPHVLIVEDDALIALDLEDELTDLGFDPVSVSTVAKAREAMAVRTPVIVVLDMHLRSETTFDLATDLQARGLPFLFLSGNDSSALPEGLKNTRILSKPVHIDELASVIEATSAAA